MLSLEYSSKPSDYLYQTRIDPQTGASVVARVDSKTGELILKAEIIKDDYIPPDFRHIVENYSQYYTYSNFLSAFKINWV